MLNEERDTRKLDTLRAHPQMVKPLNLAAPSPKSNPQIEGDHVNFKVRPFDSFAVLWAVDLA